MSKSNSIAIMNTCRSTLVYIELASYNNLFLERHACMYIIIYIANEINDECIALTDSM